MNCPTCKKLIERKQKGVFPFCSVRCKEIDLGRWFQEDYSLPSLISDEGQLEELVDALEKAGEDEDQLI